MIYDVRQATSYHYASPVAYANHVLRLTPIDREYQRVHAATLDFVSFVGVRQWIASGGFVEVVVGGRDERLEIGLVVGQRGAPERPIGFSEMSPGVQRDAVSLHHGFVMRDFLLRLVYGIVHFLEIDLGHNIE